MFSRYAKNASTLISWSMRRDSLKPIQCFIDKKHTIPKFPEGACDCVKYCKHSPRPSGEMSYATYQVIENSNYKNQFPTYQKELFHQLVFDRFN